ncbi:MAG TPA: RHS repeat-associated core domain-containing protein, partial [Polyangiaceae bacterium]|nr:RHS repeat-associated core domain-containing protein [Polyangiaceae bacterium]
ETLAADGTTTSIVVDKGGSRTTTSPDGTKVTETFAVQPGLGILVMYPSLSTTTLPSGLVRQTTTAVNEGAGIRTLSRTTAGFTSVHTDRVLPGGFLERRIVTAEGRQRTTVLDAAGAVRREEFPGQLPVEYNYDARGRLTSMLQGDRETRMTYVEEEVAEKGLVRTLTNALGEVTQFTWDEPGRKLSLADAEGGTSLLQKDAAGNLVDVTTPNGRTHTQAYGVTDLLDSYTAPNVGGPSTTAYAYDADNRVTSVGYPDGSSVTLDYDAAGRTTNIVLPTGALHYTYYGVNPCAGCAPGQRSSLSGPEGAVLGFEYDGRLPKAATFSGPVNGRVEWQYDTQFLPATETVTAAGVTSTLAYDRDGDGHVRGLGPSTVPAADRLKIIRNVSASPTRWTLGGASVEASYNPFGEEAGLDVRFGSTSVRSEVVLTRDQLGRVSHRDETRAGAGTSYDYAYDPTGNLTEVREDGVLRRAYDYDPNGNRLALTEDGDVRHYTYDAQDRLSSDGRFTYAYSATGALASRTNLTTSAVTGFTYDALGNLLEVALPDGTAIEYQVDGKGRRLGRSVNGVQTQGFLYGQGKAVAAELDGTGQVRSRFAYADIDSAPDLMLRAGRRYLFGKDRLGSVREVIDADSGAVVQTLRYDEFGVVLADTNPGFQPFGFAGGLYDAATGLVHFGARDYDASIGRWLSRDPIRFRSNSTNFYAYVHNDPVNLVDPSGLKIYFSSDEALEKFLPILDELYQHSPTARCRLDQLFNSKDEFTFHDDYSDDFARPHVSEDGKDLYFDPDTYPGTYKSICGPASFSPERVLAHEMGHFEGDGVPTTDDGPSQSKMENIKKNENPIMLELGDLCARTSHMKPSMYPFD